MFGSNEIIRLAHQGVEVRGGRNLISYLVNRFIIRRRVSNYREYQELFSDKKGIEIGGPSNLLSRNGILPIYPVINSLDGANFSTMTIWEGVLKEGNNFVYDRGRSCGYQYICDAIDLSVISSEKYDFVISCNCLEHVANPFRSIKEWLRVIKSNGLLLLVLPRKEGNFDHRRSVTTVYHLQNDYNSNIEEDDLTHYDEILAHHDLSMDQPAGTMAQFKDRSKRNYQNRALHHHVFDMNLLINIYDLFNIEILLMDTTKLDFIIVGRKR